MNANPNQLLSPVPADNFNPLVPLNSQSKVEPTPADLGDLRDRAKENAQLGIEDQIKQAVQNRNANPPGANTPTPGNPGSPTFEDQIRNVIAGNQIAKEIPQAGPQFDEKAPGFMEAGSVDPVSIPNMWTLTRLKSMQYPEEMVNVLNDHFGDNIATVKNGEAWFRTPEERAMGKPYRKIDNGSGILSDFVPWVASIAPRTIINIGVETAGRLGAAAIAGTVGGPVGEAITVGGTLASIAAGGMADELGKAAQKWMLGGSPELDLSNEEILKSGALSLGAAGLFHAASKGLGMFAKYAVGESPIVRQKSLEGLRNNLSEVVELAGAKPTRAGILGSELAASKKAIQSGAKPGAFQQIRDRITSGVDLVLKDATRLSNGKKLNVDGMVSDLEHNLLNKGFVHNKQGYLVPDPSAASLGEPNNAVLLQMADHVNTLKDASDNGGLTIVDLANQVKKFQNLSKFSDTNPATPAVLATYRELQNTMAKTRNKLLDNIFQSGTKEQQKFAKQAYQEAAQKFDILNGYLSSFDRFGEEGTQLVGDLIQKNSPEAVSNLKSLLQEERPELWDKVRGNWLGRILESSKDADGFITAQNFERNLKEYGSDVIDQLYKPSETNEIKSILRQFTKISKTGLRLEESVAGNLIKRATRLFMGNSLAHNAAEMSLIQRATMYLISGSQDLANKFADEDFLIDLAKESGDRKMARGIMEMGKRWREIFSKSIETKNGKRVVQLPIVRKTLESIAKNSEVPVLSPAMRAAGGAAGSMFDITGNAIRSAGEGIVNTAKDFRLISPEGGEK